MEDRFYRTNLYVVDRDCLNMGFVSMRESDLIFNCEKFYKGGYSD